MTTITLSIGQRAVLSGVLGAQQGRLADLAVGLRLLEKIRITEKDEQEAKVKVMVDGGSTRIEWDPAAKAKRIMLETADAKALKAILEQWPNFTMNEAPWVTELVKSLEPKDV